MGVGQDMGFSKGALLLTCSAALGVGLGVVRTRALLQRRAAKTMLEDDSKQVSENDPSLPSDIETFRPIGVCNSIFLEKWGTPRQGSLCPATLGHIRMYKTISPLALDGLSGYSHVWVVFVFSENTNVSKEASYLKAKSAFTFPAKIKPPLLMGKRTGVFSTRSPHRPNNIGLTLCSLESVDLRNNTITVGGVDLIDGTPILDVKPFVPADEVVNVSDLHFAPWLQQQAAKQPRVKFSDTAQRSLQRLVDEKVPKFYTTKETALVAIQQVLRLDVRGVGQGRGKEDTKRKTQKVIVDNMAVMFRVFSGRNAYEAANGKVIEANLRNELLESPQVDAVTAATIEEGQQGEMEDNALYIMVTDIDGDLTKCWVDFETGKFVENAKSPSSSDQNK